MEQQMQMRELISALADGQLQGEAFARGVEAAGADRAGREAWNTYHLIGDVLRSGELAACSAPTAFLARLEQRLLQEPHQPAAEAIARPPQQGVAISQHPAANDASFRWKLVAGFASFAAVAAIGWSVVGAVAKPEQGQLAAAPGTVLAGGQGGLMIRDPNLDEFLAAHRQLGGASALQTPAGFLRNATFEGPSR
jgi:sigma-E factor negative regulatory protein RseA